MNRTVLAVWALTIGIDLFFNAGVFSRQSFHPSLEMRDLSQDLESYVEMFRHQAERAGLTLSTDIAQGVKAETDQIHLRRAIGAVIENAVKYSRPDAGGNSVVVSLVADGRDAVIAVKDEGVGLEPEDKKRVFERFYRAGDEITRKVRGSGLGLFLAREIIVAHGGRIGIQSTSPGAGTTVEIRLPLVER